MKPPPTSVRSLPADAKRQVIFDAAREVIMQRGFDAAKMEEIAARAGVGKGTLYNFFSSKEDLFLSLVLDGFERLRDMVDAEVEPVQDPWRRFEVAWRTLMLQVFPVLNLQWPFIYQLWGFLARDPAARSRMFDAWRALYRDRENEIVTAIHAGQATGRFGVAIDPSALALLLMAIFDGLLHRAMFDGNRVDPEDVLRSVLDLVSRALDPRRVPDSDRRPPIRARKSTKQRSAPTRLAAEARASRAALRRPEPRRTARPLRVPHSKPDPGPNR